MGRASVSPAADAAMDRSAAGDDSAFETLYDLLAPRLCGFLTRQTHNPALAEDLVQQTLLLNLRCTCATPLHVGLGHVLPLVVSSMAGIALGWWLLRLRPLSCP